MDKCIFLSLFTKVFGKESEAICTFLDISFDKIHLRPRGTFSNQVGTSFWAWVMNFNLRVQHNKNCQNLRLQDSIVLPTVRYPEAPSAPMKLAYVGPADWTRPEKNLLYKSCLLTPSEYLTYCFESGLLIWTDWKQCLNFQLKMPPLSQEFHWHKCTHQK